MKTKIVNEIFEKDAGYSKVTIQNKYGHFTGAAWCHPDDVETFSQFQGERIAATRANISFLKFRIQQEKAKLKAIQSLQNDFDHEYDLNPNGFYGPVTKHIFKTIKRYKENIENFKTSIEILEDSIRLMDEERQKILLRSNKNK